MKTRIAHFSLIGVVALVLTVVRASADTLYNNGPVNGQVDGWAINFGFVVSDSFALTRNSSVQGFDFDAWVIPGDRPETVDWSISSSPNGGTIFASGTANLTSQFLFVNRDGFDIDEETVSGLNIPLSSSLGYWLNLQNAVTQQGSPLYWDENSGPSLASENALGTIPSESFDIIGTQGGSTPEPSSLMLVGSGILGITSLVRRRMLDG